MASPTHQARTTPTGRMLRDGYSTKIAFEQTGSIPALDPELYMWEKTVKPPGLDAGDAIDITTMHNIDWRTFSPRALITMTDCNFVAAYDPEIYNAILNIINIPGNITVHFPDGSRLSFFGFLRTFEVADHAEGSFPEANCSITCTNFDPTNSVEAAPLMTQVAGT